MPKTIACVATLDTKGREIEYISNILRKRGHHVLTIDTGILDESSITPDITRHEVAKATNMELKEIIALGDQGKCAEKMTEGAVKVIKDLYTSGKIDGIISIGGGMGTGISTTAMRELPVGFPKLMVSIMVAKGGTQWYVGTKDIVLVPSVCDIQGLNRLSRKILANAAGAIAGMVEMAGEKEVKDFPEKPMVVMSENGTTTKCGVKVKAMLEGKGFEVVIFAGAGVGGRCQEEFIRDNPVAGVIELSIYEVTGELLGAASKSGPERLETAGDKGIPQLITPGSVNFVAFLGPETVPPHYKDRQLLSHNPQSTLMRVNAQEFELAGKVIADKLNRAKGPVRILIPTRGFSSVDQEGKPFYDPQTDRVLIDSLKRHLKASIPVREIEAHMNDQIFAEAVVKEFLQIMV